jgi:hypothetical protein
MGRMNSQRGNLFAGKKIDPLRGTSIAERSQDEVAVAANPEPEVFEQALCRNVRTREGTKVEWKDPVIELQAVQGK